MELMGTMLGTAVIALLFGAFGLLRPADRRPDGCHGCTHEGGGCDGSSCALLEDL
jgi:hypothetical protein